MSAPETEPPINPLPPVVAALFLVIVGIEAAFSLGARGLVGGPEAVGWRLGALQRYAFSGEIFDWMWQRGVWPAEHLMRLVAYPFVHGNFTHALFTGVMLLALGKIVGDAIGSVRVLAIFVASTIGAALIYALVLDTGVPLIGAFPPVYGLIGAFTYMLWLRLGQLGEKQIRAFTLIGFLLGIQLVFSLFPGSGPDWVADLGGFAVGFVVTIPLAPGGWARILERLRGGQD